MIQYELAGFSLMYQVAIEIKITYIPDEDYVDNLTWNSKKETGFVGILNVHIFNFEKVLYK